MMHFKNVLFIQLIFPFILIFNSFGNNTSDTTKNKAVVFYSYGFPDRWWSGEAKDTCINYIENKFGFTTERKAGCVITSKQSKEWDKHNRKMERKMKFKHGFYWRKRFEEQLKKCENH